MPGQTTAANMLRSDSDLVELVLKGAHKSYEELVRRYKSIVTAYCYSRVKDRDTAEDLSQEVFVRGFQLLANLKKPSAFHSWLLSIAHNACVDFLRAKSRTVSLDSSTDSGSQPQIVLVDRAENSAAEILSSEETREKVLSAINNLPEEYRVTLVLRHVNGLSCDEVALALNVSVGTITSRLSRARKLLRERLKHHME